MNFNLNKCVEVLSRTPAVLDSLLGGLSDEWIHNNEGEATWSPFDIVQITRVMARQYTREVGPWKHYLPILNR